MTVLELVDVLQRRGRVRPRARHPRHRDARDRRAAPVGGEGAQDARLVAALDASRKLSDRRSSGTAPTWARARPDRVGRRDRCRRVPRRGARPASRRPRARRPPPPQPQRRPLARRPARGGRPRRPPRTREGVRRVSTRSCTSPAPTRPSPAPTPTARSTDTLVSARRVGEACAAVGVARVVYVSTVHVYGAALRPDATITEDVAPAAAVGLRDRTARDRAPAGRGGRRPGRAAPHERGRRAGRPRVDRWSLVANDLARQFATTGALRLHSDGRQWRDFVAVADVCRVITAALAPRRSRRARTTSDRAGRSRCSSSPSWSATRPRRRPARARRCTSARPASSRTRRRTSSTPAGCAALDLGADTAIGDAIAETVRFCLDHRADLGDPDEE